MKKTALPIFILCIWILLTACRTDLKAEALPSPVPAETASLSVPTTTPDLVRSATPTPVPTPTPSPTPEPTEAPTPEPTPDLRFTFVWASDTQTMIVAQAMRQNYLALCSWVAEEAEAHDFALFIHSGDMVDDGDSYGQWRLFLEGVDSFRDKVPFFWALGNHDEGMHYLSPWKKHLYPDDVPPEQVYDDGTAWYRIFEKNGTELMLLSVGYRFSHSEWVLKWAREACLAHPNLPVILVTHEYLTAKGGMANRADRIEAQLVAACPNIRLVLCGHARGISHAEFRYDDDGDGGEDRTVNVLMYDIQTELDRYGYLCLLTYDPRDNTLSVDSYSPLWDDHVYDDEHPELEQFVLHDVF